MEGFRRVRLALITKLVVHFAQLGSLVIYEGRGVDTVLIGYQDEKDESS